jgi:large subunit ribosomal protein L1
MKRSKRYRAATKVVEARRVYGVEEGLGILQAFDKPKFDETVELSIKLGIDPKRPEQALRGSVALPKGIGKEKRVICFAEGKEAEAATAAGAAEVGGESLAKKILDGWTDFDVAIATPASMKFVGKLGRVLGPQGKMPTPKSGTVTTDVATAVSEFKAGKIEYRSHGANLQVPVGKRSFPAADLKQNIDAFMEHLRALKPAAVKGHFVLKTVLSASMSPAVQLALDDMGTK